MTTTVVNITGGPSNLYMGGVDLGSTTGGVKMEINEDTNPIEVDQVPMELDELLQKIGSKIIAVLAETHAANLVAVLGGYGVGGSTLPSLIDFTVEGPAPDGLTRTFTVHKGRISRNTSYEFKKGEQTGIPIEIKMFADLAQAEGEQLFSWADA